MQAVHIEEIKNQPRILAVIADVLPLFISGIKRALNHKGPVNYSIARNMEQVDAYFENGRNRFLVITDSFLSQFSEEIIPAIIKKYTGAKIIVITENRFAGYLQRLVSMGVSGLIHKSTTGFEIEKTLLHLEHNIEPYYCAVISAIIARGKTQSKKTALSEQQLKVFLLMLQNLPNKLIADKLKLEYETVRGYRKEVLGKIKISGFSCPLEYAFSMGYITMEHFTRKQNK